VLVWTAYSRNRRRVAAFTLGEGLSAVREIYEKVKSIIPNISHIYSDANSCYREAFKKMGISEPHTMTKAQTHLIESSNSSIRDNLARFNRKSKRFSKSIDMLIISLELFFNRHLVLNNTF
jgi:IS1 family transposase